MRTQKLAIEAPYFGEIRDRSGLRVAGNKLTVRTAYMLHEAQLPLMHIIGVTLPAPLER